MAPAVILAAAIALALLLAVGGLRWRAVFRRRGLAPPVTEAEARAHAMPLTRSVLSVNPSRRDRPTGDP